MKLVRGAWKLLVGIKDALVLVAMLLFFALLFAALNARPGTTTIRNGALVLDLNGSLVEQPEEVAPFALLSGQDVAQQFRLRDVLQALQAAKTDDRVKAVVLDLDRFAGGYPASVGEVADALVAVRKAGKPVLAYATGYTDPGYRLAAAASEVWVHPLGGSLFTGPGGNRLYYKGLIDKLGVNAHIYRVGKYKSFVEPYTRADQSPEAREMSEALYSGFLDEYVAGVQRARPKARIRDFMLKPADAVIAQNGDIPRANLAAGLVDKIGDRLDFEKRVAAIAGSDTGKTAPYRAIRFVDYVAAHPLPDSGNVGVVTVAGDIVDGEADPGTAGGDTIATFVRQGLAKGNLKALVVRVDSPGGSALASETIRNAVLEAKRRGLPVVISMAGVAASGGYWVSTAGDTIFAEPTTITGSIGIFGMIPTFEQTLAKIGVTSDGVKTTPLSGQPDVFGGVSPEVDRLFQAGIEKGYRDFIGRVAKARGKTPAQVNEIAQGRVWAGGTARQIGLVDRFGTLADAVKEAGRRAKISPDEIKVQYLEKKPGWAADLVRQMERQEEESAPADAFARIAWGQRQMLALALGDMKRLLGARSAIQARCLECGGMGPVTADPADRTLLTVVMERLGL
jgi:protease-4